LTGDGGGKWIEELRPLQSISNHETSFLVQRSVNGVGFTTIATVGDDTTSLTDPSIPLNNEGDASLDYQLIAVDDAGQSQPSPSTGLDVEATSIKSVKVVLSSTPANFRLHPQSGKSVNGFQFVDAVKVEGTNLQNVSFLQELQGKTTYTDPVTGLQILPQPGNPKMQSPDFQPDGVRQRNGQWTKTDWAALQPAPGGKSAIALYDEHNFRFMFNFFAGGPEFYSAVSEKTYKFNEMFKYPQPTARDPHHMAQQTTSWGYDWSNAAYVLGQFTVPGLPPGTVTVASPQAWWGGPNSLLTGTNLDLSGIAYVPDINKIYV
jgi:hypothetical protein